MTTAAHSPSQNSLLAALSAAELAPLERELEWVPLLPGQMIYAPGQRMQHVFFPTTAIVSLHHVTASGGCMESAGVGREGVVGVSLFMGGNTTSSSAVVLTGGHGYRLHLRVLQQAFDGPGLLRQVLLLYVQALVTQVFQTAACNRHHTVDQQLCRFLLRALDRVPSNDLVMTQEQVAGLLGVRREGITAAAGHLQRAGHISYRRGHISVLSRAGLEAAVCECYGVVRKEMDRLSRRH